MDELIKDMEAAREFFMGLARATTTEEPGSGFRFFKAAVTAEKAIAELNKRIQREMEMEGGGTTWWYVCPECHGAIDSQDHFCRHCGQAVKRDE